MLRVQVRILQTDSSVKLIDVLASLRVAGYTLLIHRCENGFTATYAPCGMRAGGPYESVAEVTRELDRQESLIGPAIQRALDSMAQTNMPAYAPETGIESFDWQWREQCRFGSGEYLPVPAIEGISYAQEHWLHLSVTKTESDFIAYTPTEQYGANDRQVRMKFGKYLRKHFPDLTDAAIQSAVSRLRSEVALAESPATLHFATDRETITDIFETEMCACDSTATSCMYGKFKGEHRPYHVYADSPDVAVAYVMERGEIVSRSVINTSGKEWVRTYSRADGDSAADCETLRALLKDAGYHKGDLIGCRLTKLPTHTVMLPYIDSGGMGVIDQGKYWEVCDDSDDSADWVADCTDGTATRKTEQCPDCENDVDDCECSTCECCDHHGPDGCDDCSFCDDCGGCTEHDRCNCVRCVDCSEIIFPRRRYTSRCDCARCGECNELEADCECEKCGECGCLLSDCECEEEETNEETELAETLEPVA